MAGEEIEEQEDGKWHAQEPKKSPADFTFVVVLFELCFHGVVEVVTEISRGLQ